jgi:hypothetical protein
VSWLVDQAADEVVEALAFHDGDDLIVVGDAVVTGGEGTAFGGRLLLGELVGVALAAVDEDREVREVGGAAAGDADPGAGLAGGARRLPEDCFAAALDAGEHELGAVLARAVEHEIDRDPTPLAGTDRDPLDDLGFFGPALGAVAVDLRGPWPAVAGFEHELAVGERQPDEEREARLGVGVGGNLEQERVGHRRGHDACWSSRVRSPSKIFRRPTCPLSAASSR